jgi:threonine synthase
MTFYNTSNPEQISSFENAVFKGLAEGNRLFIPSSFSVFDSAFFKNSPDINFQEISCNAVQKLLREEIPAKIKEEICEESFNFPVRLNQPDDKFQNLELFHRPSLADLLKKPSFKTLIGLDYEGFKNSISGTWLLII